MRCGILAVQQRSHRLSLSAKVGTMSVAIPLGGDELYSFRFPKRRSCVLPQEAISPVRYADLFLYRLWFVRHITTCVPGEKTL